MKTPIESGFDDPTTMNTEPQQPDTRPDHHEASRKAFEMNHAYWAHHKKDGSYTNVFEDTAWVGWCRALDWQASQQPYLSALRAEAKRIAGHIRKPWTAQEIAARLQGGDYSAELTLHHLLRLVAASPK